MITFVECPIQGYAPRTRKNVEASDLTIAIAADFRTAGEKLTSSFAKNNYYPIALEDLNNPVYLALAKETFVALTPKDLNMAGNGIYTLHKYGYNQEELDRIVSLWMAHIFDKANFTPNTIRSGGQTGIDEAALKAADSLGVKNVICYAPKGWMFRNINGKDVSDETLFKARFN